MLRVSGIVLSVHDDETQHSKYKNGHVIDSSCRIDHVSSFSCSVFRAHLCDKTHFLVT